MPATVIADLSGSVVELGKKRTLDNLLRTVRFFSSEVEVYSWQENILPVRDISDMKPGGKSSLSLLCDFMNSNGNKRFLVISDGHFDARDSLPPLGAKLTTVALGADADIYALKRISGEERCFMPENIRAAFDSASYNE